MNWLYLHGNIIKLHKFLISHIALNKTSLTYTNILALFGLIVMLCDHDAESAKHWDNFLSHCICAIAARNDWPIHQMDIDNTYVNVDLHKPIYMKQPEGYIQK